MVLLWQGGNCNRLAPRAVTFTVIVSTQNDSGYTLSTDNDAMIEGNVIRDREECTLSLSITEPDGIGLGFIGTARSDYNVVERNNDLEGSGMLTVGPPENCLQAFSIEGDKEGLE